MSDDVWMARERERFETGEYKRLPWDNVDWYHVAVCTRGEDCQLPQHRAAVDPFPFLSWHGKCAHHYAHVSTFDPSKLAYTPDGKHGEQDRQLSTKPGRYLTKYLSEVLAPSSVQDWCGEFAKANEKHQLKLATSPEDIVRVYEKGPRSCMANEDCVRAYGAGDLAIAYVERESRIVARTVCWPSKRIFSPYLYGDESRLRAALEAEGYESGRLDGARLLLIEERAGYVAPYVDGNYRATPDSGYLVMGSSGVFGLSNTGGYVNGGTRCGNCSEYVDPEDSATVNGESWCDDCRDSDAFWCEGCDDYMPHSSYRCTVGDDSYCDDCADRLLAHCDRCSQWRAQEDAFEVEGDTLCASCFESEAFYCEHCSEERYAERSQNVMGVPWCGDCIDSDASECRDCGEAIEVSSAIAWRCESCADALPEDAREALERVARIDADAARHARNSDATVSLRVSAADSRMVPHWRTSNPLLWVRKSDRGSDYNITHQPSGLHLGIYVPTLEVARAVVRDIDNELDALVWCHRKLGDSDGPADVMDRIRSVLSAVRSQYTSAT